MHKTNHATLVYQDDSGNQWTPLASGKYNHVYTNREGSLVMKIQRFQNTLTDAPERSVRLWNLINPNILPKAHVAYDKHGSAVGWVCPFIVGKQASDEEIAIGIIDVFNRTGRIIVDGTSKNNFLKTPAGDIVCIDVGMALEFQPRLHPPRLSRQISDISVNTWDTYQAGYQTFFQDSIVYGLTKSIQTVKALIFIQENRPHIRQADFLKLNPWYLNQIAFGYDYQRLEQEPLLALRILDDQAPPPPATIFNLTDLSISLDKIAGESTLELTPGSKG